jgi:Holliday junction resolvase RusA-like endonuclease
MNFVIFTVVGHPKPAGSKRGFAIKKGGAYTGRVAMVDSSGQAGTDWRHDVACAARDAMAGRPPMHGPLRMTIAFGMERPKAHYRSGKYWDQLKPSAPKHHTQTPDTLKLARGVEDAIKGVVYVDDCQITMQHHGKTWAPRGRAQHGVSVKIERVDDDGE